MPLIVEDIIKEGIAPRDDLVPFYIEVDSWYLSKQYDIKLFYTAWVEGTVLDVSRVTGEMTLEERKIVEEHVIGKNVKPYITPALFLPFDRLYFDKNSWAILRDTAIFPHEYRVKIKIVKLIIKDPLTQQETSYSFYPYRDIVVKISWQNSS